MLCSLVDKVLFSEIAETQRLARKWDALESAVDSGEKIKTPLPSPLHSRTVFTLNLKVQLFLS